MGKFTGYTLISDFDGTLRHTFTRENAGIPQRNLDALRRFEEEGGHFILATGRSVESLRPFLCEVTCKLPCVLYNGAAVYDYGAEKFLLIHPIIKSEVIGFFEEVSRMFPRLGIEVAVVGEHFMIRDNMININHAGEERPGFIKTDFSGTDGEWLKLITIGSPEETERIYQFATEHAPCCMRTTKSSEHFCEFIAADANKYSAAARLMDMLGLPIDKSCGIGDFFNDIELITRTAIGAVPSNAPDGVKALAPHVVCDCREGAAADFISYIETIIKS